MGVYESRPHPENGGIDLNRSELSTRLASRWDSHYTYLDIGDGWLPLLGDLVSELESIDPLFTVAQIKSKLAGLRAYCYPSEELSEVGDSTFYAAIDAAEARSLTICETCGEDGHLINDHGWWLTTCTPCFERRSSA